MSATRTRRKPAAGPISDGDVPHAPEAERAVLAAILVAPEHLPRVRSILDEGAFPGEPHRRIFHAIVALSQRNVAIDPVTVQNALAETGDLELVGGPAYLAGLVDGASRSVNAEHYARIVRDKAIRRGLMQRALELAGACRNGHETHDITDAGAALFRETLAADPEARGRVLSTADALVEYAADAAKGPGRKVRTGLKPIDEATDGLAPGEVATAVARPQVGKSALASQILVNAAIAGVPSVFFSLEMPRLTALERLLMQRLGLTRHEVERHGKAGWRDLTDAQRDMMGALQRTIVIVDRGKSGIADLDAAMIEATAILGRPPQLAAIDYLGLMGSGAKNLPLYQRISEAAVDVKSFAKRHGVALVLLSQAGRDADSKRSAGAKELGLDAARDSGQIEEACDFMFTLWRPELDPGMRPNERDEVRGELGVAVVKSRRGPLVDFRLHLDAGTLRIREWWADA